MGKPLGQRQKGVIARSILFRPGGRLACELARHGVILRVNNWVFCHGGLLPHHGKYKQSISTFGLGVERCFLLDLIYHMLIVYLHSCIRRREDK